MKAAVLGCGPAGLFAAHAVANMCKNYGEPLWLAIFSVKRPSPLYGAQYLHAPIPGLTDMERVERVAYRLIGGSTDDYRRKVYGQAWNGTVSPEDLDRDHLAWDIRSTYMAAYDMYSEVITDVRVDPVTVHNLINSQAYNLIINSIPLDALCHQGHHFGFTEIVAAGDAPDLGIDINRMYRTDDGEVVLNASNDVAWYRKSRVFGHTTVEWPSVGGQPMRVPVRSAAVVRKPTMTDCDCYPGVVRVGRYGSWQKGVLSHQAYFDVCDVLDVALKGDDGATAQAAQEA